MRISELARLNVKNDGHFFSKENLASNNETLKSFTVTESFRYPQTLVVVRKKDGKQFHFSSITGRIRLCVHSAGGM